MSIEKRINKLKPYIIGIRFLQDSTVLDVVLKEGWIIQNSNTILSKKSEDGNFNYYMVYSEIESVTLDDLLDYLESGINANIERELKLELFRQKVKDLEDLFKKTPLNDLESMKFNLNNDSLIPNFYPEPEEIGVLSKKLVEAPIIEEPVIVPDPVFEEPIIETIVAPEPYDELADKEIPYDNPSKIKEVINKKPTINSKPKKVMNFDLPPRNGGGIELAEFEEVKAKCNCGPNDACPVCVDSKY